MNVTIDILDMIIGGVVSIVVLYAHHYVMAKAKRNAVEKKDKEIRDIEHKHQKEVETLKDNLAKRKYQYEKKYETYLKFFNILDDSAFKSNEYIKKAIDINHKSNIDFIKAVHSHNKTA